MKKIFTLSSCVALALTSSAAISLSPISYKDLVGKSASADITAPGHSLKLQGIPSAIDGTRSIDEPETDCKADEASFYYFGDLLENGTGVYYLFLSSAGINQGNPTHSGQIARIAFVGEGSDAGNPVLPAGEYTISEDGELAKGSIIADMTDFYDVFPHPEDELMLVGYPFTPLSGSLTIEPSEGGYKIDFSMDGVLIDEEDQVLAQQPCTAVYEGEVPYEDIYAYPPMSGDVVMDIPNVSGRYMEGNYSLAFYSDGMLDEDGFIVAGGELLNVEIFTVESSPMNLDDIIGVKTPVDVFTEGQVPGHFMNGIWYEIFSGFYAAMGTSYTLYNEMGEVSEVGLATDGTISVSKDGDSDFAIEFDLTTEDGYKLTGKWKGDLGMYISDFSENAGVDGISEGIKTISGGKGKITAPADAKVFSIAGQPVGRDNLAPGIYVVTVKGRTVKVVVK